MSTPREILEGLLRDKAPILMKTDSDFTEFLQSLVEKVEMLEEVGHIQQDTIDKVNEAHEKLINLVTDLQNRLDHFSVVLPHGAPG